MNSRVVLFIILILATFLRVYKLDERGPFTDEKFTLLNANGFWVGAANQEEIISKTYFTPADFWTSKGINDYFEAIAHSDFGTHIIYNGVIHVWMAVFGNSDFAIRLLSVLFNLLMLFVVYRLIKRVFKSEVPALISVFLLAIEPLNIAQSHIARSYTLSFLLVILATDVFLRLLDFRTKRKTLLFLIYAALIGASLLNHYLNFLVPLSHAIVFLFARKDKKLWTGFISAGVFSCVLMLWWFTSGGGHLSMSFLKDKNEKHLAMAQMKDNPLGSAIQLSSPEVVIKKTISLFLDSNTLTNGIYQNFNGVKNMLISLFFALMLGFSFIFYEKNKKQVAFSFMFLAFSLLVYFNTLAFSFLITSVFYFALYFGFKYVIKNLNFKEPVIKTSLVFVCLLMLFLPIFFVIYDAFKNGHTTSLTHRYIGVASPFVAILIAFGLSELLVANKRAFVFIGIVFLLQIPNLVRVIGDFYKDRSNNYAFFVPERIKNPYKRIAEDIEKVYAKGDTVLIPSFNGDVYSTTFGLKKTVTYTDAQYLNLYLPKDSKIIERVDPSEPNKFFIKKENGDKVLLADLEGLKFRY